MSSINESNQKQAFILPNGLFDPVKSLSLQTITVALTDLAKLANWFAKAQEQAQTIKARYADLILRLKPLTKIYGPRECYCVEKLRYKTLKPIFEKILEIVERIHSAIENAPVPFFTEEFLEAQRVPLRNLHTQMDQLLLIGPEADVNYGKITPDALNEICVIMNYNLKAYEK